ncbi:hypothetical protein B0A55_08487 [Friedmanniomyces simplex]|uniref:NAD(P)-binding domain-containing protein n=1 Tax=Friedmanniomyces simplex TaxID=329884 RepID=A0A4U0X094_9PEZI|nr:hypothetical protein B0A55_08487 [Friedmanniomyces simplex]
MHILVLGPSGITFIEEALRSGQKVTIYARNPSKLPRTINEDQSVTVFQGTFDDLDAAARALRSGADALVSFAGPGIRWKGTPVADFYAKFFPLLPSSSIKHVMICATASFKAPGDSSPNWLWWFGAGFVWLVGDSAYAEQNGIGRATTGLPLDQVEWTLFRVPHLTNGKALPVQTGMMGSGTDGMFLSRPSLAVWILQELRERNYVGKTPMVSNPGWSGEGGLLLAFRSSPAFITLVVAYAVFAEQFLFAIIVPVAPFSLEQRAHIPGSGIQYWLAWLFATYGIASVVSSREQSKIAQVTTTSTLTKTQQSGDGGPTVTLPDGYLSLWACSLLGATILLWFANSKSLLILTRILQGVGATVIWTTGLAILVDAVGEARIGESMGYVAIALNLSTLTAPMLGGVVFARAGYNAVFAMACGVAAVDILLRFVMIERISSARPAVAPLRGSATKLELGTGCYLCELYLCKKPALAVSMTSISAERASNLESNSLQQTKTPDGSELGKQHHWQIPPLLRLLSSWRFFSAMWGGFAYATLLAGFQAVLPLRLNEIFGWDSVGGGLIFVPLVAPGLLGPLIGGLTDRFGHRWFATAGFVGLCPALILLRLIQHDSLTQKAVLCVLLGIVGLCGTCLLEPLIAEITYLGGGQGDEGVGGVKVRSYAQVYALFNVAWELGDTARPLLAGLMVESVGWETMSLTLGLLAGHPEDDQAG